MMVISTESKLRYHPYTSARGRNVSYYGLVAHYRKSYTIMAPSLLSVVLPILTKCTTSLSCANILVCLSKEPQEVIFSRTDYINILYYISLSASPLTCFIHHISGASTLNVEGPLHVSF